MADAMAFLALAGLVPAFIFLAPESKWAPQALFAVLLGACFVSASTAARVRTMSSFDAGSVAVLLGVAFLGPLPGACLGSAPEISRWLGEGKRLVVPVFNAASWGWGCLSAAFVLEALDSGAPIDGSDPAAYPAVAAAGLILLLVNYLVVSTWEALSRGVSFLAMVRRELLPTAPLTAALLAAGTGTAFAYAQFDMPGLAPLAAIVLMPRSLLPRTLRSRPPSELSRSEAAALYADAIATVLRLSRTQKRVLDDAATHLGGPASLSRIDDFQEVMQTVLYCHERWDGEGGFPGMLAGESIPLESRILATADVWSELTSKGTRELSAGGTLAELRSLAGSQLDPGVVAAAVQAIEDELLPLRRPET